MTNTNWTAPPGWHIPEVISAIYLQIRIIQKGWKGTAGYPRALRMSHGLFHIPPLAPSLAPSLPL
eukprot:1272609-Rhodomonas_salina.2